MKNKKSGCSKFFKPFANQSPEHNNFKNSPINNLDNKKYIVEIFSFTSVLKKDNQYNPYAKEALCDYVKSRVNGPFDRNFLDKLPTDGMFSINCRSINSSEMKCCVQYTEGQGDHKYMAGHDNGYLFNLLRKWQKGDELSSTEKEDICEVKSVAVYDEGWKRPKSLLSNGVLLDRINYADQIKKWQTDQSKNEQPISNIEAARILANLGQKP